MANTAPNRRLTFGVRDRAGVLRDQAAGIAALGVALAITTASLGLLDRFGPHASRTTELAVLVLANALATLIRFVLLRLVIGRSGSATSPLPSPAANARPASIERTVS